MDGSMPPMLGQCTAIAAAVKVVKCMSCHGPACSCMSKRTADCPAFTIATRTRPAVLQVVLRQQRGRTRLPWRKLCLDILSVLCGLRPAAMLDYAVVPRHVLLQLATAVRASAGPAGALPDTACSRCRHVEDLCHRHTQLHNSSHLAAALPFICMH